LSDARVSFRSLFGRDESVRAEAPGRVNLIGEHTDYSGGLVLPLAIPQKTRVALAPREGPTARVFSADVKDLKEPAAFTIGAEKKRKDWLDYVQGVAQALAKAGHRVGGFDALVTSEVPLGSGLSSSAALEVSLLRALREAFRLAIDDVALALLGQRAENDFVGAPVGVMDQMASSLAGEDVALFLDTRSLKYEKVPLPRDAELVVIDSGISHDHATGEYRKRREEVTEAARLLSVKELRDANEADLPRIAELPPPLDRRARHVVTENARVGEAVNSLRSNDLVRLGRLLDASHASLRDDFQVSTPEVDALVALARKQPGVFGARITGGGFGGSIVALAKRGEGREAGERAVEGYGHVSGRRAALLLPEGVPALRPRVGTVDSDHSGALQSGTVR
jgi:galactokinase